MDARHEMIIESACLWLENVNPIMKACIKDIGFLHGSCTTHTRGHICGRFGFRRGLGFAADWKSVQMYMSMVLVCTLDLSMTWMLRGFVLVGK